MLSAGKGCFHELAAEDGRLDCAWWARWARADSATRFSAVHRLDGVVQKTTPAARTWSMTLSSLSSSLLPPTQDTGGPWTVKKWPCFTRASWTKTENDTQSTTGELFLQLSPSHGAARRAGASPTPGVAPLHTVPPGVRRAANIAGAEELSVN